MSRNADELIFATVREFGEDSPGIIRCIVDLQMTTGRPRFFTLDIPKRDLQRLPVLSERELLELTHGMLDRAEGIPLESRDFAYGTIEDVDSLPPSALEILGRRCVSVGLVGKLVQGRIRSTTVAVGFGWSDGSTSMLCSGPNGEIQVLSTHGKLAIPDSLGIGQDAAFGCVSLSIPHELSYSIGREVSAVLPVVDDSGTVFGLLLRFDDLEVEISAFSGRIMLVSRFT